MPWKSVILIYILSLVPTHTKLVYAQFVGWMNECIDYGNLVFHVNKMWDDLDILDVFSKWNYNHKTESIYCFWEGCWFSPCCLKHCGHIFLYIFFDLTVGSVLHYLFSHWNKNISWLCWHHNFMVSPTYWPFFFFSWTCGVWRFPGQGPNPSSSSCNSCHSFGNAGSLPSCAMVGTPLLDYEFEFVILVSSFKI